MFRKILVMFVIACAFTKAQACISCILLIGGIGGYAVSHLSEHNHDDRECRTEIYHYDSNGNIKSRECVK